MIEGAQDESEAGMIFQRLWSLKESYIKARGDGLAFAPLSRACFFFEGGSHPASCTRARAVVDGQPLHRWACGPKGRAQHLHAHHQMKNRTVGIPWTVKEHEWESRGKGIPS